MVHPLGHSRPTSWHGESANVHNFERRDEEMFANCATKSEAPASAIIPWLDRSLHPTAPSSNKLGRSVKVQARGFLSRKARESSRPRFGLSEFTNLFLNYFILYFGAGLTISVLPICGIHILYSFYVSYLKGIVYWSLSRINNYLMAKYSKDILDCSALASLQRLIRASFLLLSIKSYCSQLELLVAPQNALIKY